MEGCRRADGEQRGMPLRSLRKLAREPDWPGGRFVASSVGELKNAVEAVQLENLSRLRGKSDDAESLPATLCAVERDQEKGNGGAVNVGRVLEINL